MMVPKLILFVIVARFSFSMMLTRLSFFMMVARFSFSMMVARLSFFMMVAKLSFFMMVARFNFSMVVASLILSLIAFVARFYIDLAFPMATHAIRVGLILSVVNTGFICSTVAVVAVMRLGTYLSQTALEVTLTSFGRVITYHCIKFLKHENKSPKIVNGYG